MRLSIVIDNYNYREFVAQAIESSLAQTHDDVELIVVDDGSTDGSVDVINRFADRIKLIAKPNGGQGSAYNAGFAASSGEIVIFLDADDWLYPEAAANVAAAWHGGVSKVQFPLLMVDREGRSLGRQIPHHMHDHQALALVREFGTYGSPPGSGNAYSASFLRQVLPMSETQWRIAADSVPILLAPAYGEVVTLPAAQGAYRLHRPTDDGSLLMNNAPTGLWSEYERADSTKRFVEQSLSRLNQKPRVPQLLAPWEARLAAICLRFGDQDKKEGKDKGAIAPGAASVSRGKLMRLALQSVWHWPMIGLGMKLVTSIWMMGVLVLPRPLALRLAQLHRTSTGASTA
ncbi:MAG: glycosyltransferase family 2 protein [Cytophagales bacterium]|nr:glycosyltransferase family 2 protein [Rhizobacter sp.]